jgi:hypothetical protein
MKIVLMGLRLLGLIFVVVCLCHLVWAPRPKASLEFTINGVAESRVVLDSAQSGKNSLFVSCDTDSLTPALRFAGLTSFEVSNIVWRAALTVSGEHGILVSSNALLLRPGGLIESRRYFKIASWNLRTPERLEIKLVPHEPCPLSPEPSLAIRPSPLYFESYAVDQIKWLILYFVSAIMAIALAADLIIRFHSSCSGKATSAGSDRRKVPSLRLTPLSE